MNRRLIFRSINIALAILVAAAVAQELRKPKSDRTWHGKVFRILPYDFRRPTWERFKESYWNPYDRHVLTPRMFGIGWAVNFYSLFENLGLVRTQCPCEDDFLLPNEHMKKILRQNA